MVYEIFIVYDIFMVYEHVGSAPLINTVLLNGIFGYQMLAQSYWYADMMSSSTCNLKEWIILIFQLKNISVIGNFFYPHLTT